MKRRRKNAKASHSAAKPVLREGMSSAIESRRVAEGTSQGSPPADHSGGSNRTPWRSRGWTKRILISRTVFGISLLAMLFAGGQLHYSRREHLSDLAHTRRQGDELVQEAFRVLTIASQMTLPLPTSVATDVAESKKKLASAQAMGADAVLCRELSALANILLPHYAEADESLRELQQVAQQRPISYLVLGSSYFAQEKYQDAEEVLTTGLAISHARADLLSLRARVRLRRQDVSAARRDADQAISLDPTSAFGHFALGLALSAGGLERNAANAFATAARLAPTWLEPHLASAALYIEDADFQEAARHLEAAGSLASDDATTHLAQAAVRWTMGEATATASSLSEARELMPLSYVGGLYTGVHVWRTDLPQLDEFNGNFLLEYRDKHQSWRLERFELALLRALSATRIVPKFLRFEDALFDICVAPVYHPDREFLTVQMIHLANRSPHCLSPEGVTVVWTTEQSLSLARDQIPRRSLSEVESARINTFLSHKEKRQ